MNPTNNSMNPSLIKTDIDLYAGQEKLRGQRLDMASATPQTSTLVFLHEGLGSIAQWKAFPAALCKATGCPGFLYERRGYGIGAPPPDPDSHQWPMDYLEQEARILDGILEQCQVEHPVLIGHSDGGTIALLYAATHSTKLRGVITEAAHIFVEDVTVKGIQRVVQIYETLDLKAKLARYHGERTDFVFQRWADRWLAPLFRSWNVEKHLAAITCPLLVIQGEKDEYATLAQVDGIKNGVSGPVEINIVEECMHVPHLQAKKKVLKVMARFIASLGPDRF
ncbi:putative hydrolase (alpha/beta fold protein) [Desulforapulum autotrophicum HRM2]|uniref:Hydrolase (Alpha/beta fold protein) n=1 Tax=Desulforapulum autotrophicum (strain ATCC 43914 / DSM 3382 / VKM B-1955 / HRM2) TaxID=177437 RepID=C0QIS3_DESAH|nr:alpha/beta hydrolase [Desulforapulum autotrophicum]ACN13713.1 putative hydrolase (alpha/beta fold protein) [Desulforapulum autotrophicum HRM2]